MADSAPFSDILPDVLAEVAEAAGLDAALTLRRELGGTRVHVSREPRAGTKLVDCVGLEAAELIAGRFGGETIPIPQGRRRQTALIARLLKDGVQVQAIARLLGCHAETVRRIKNGRAKARQFDLFERASSAD